MTLSSRIYSWEAWRPTYRWHLPRLEKLMALDETEYPLVKEVWKE